MKPATPRRYSWRFGGAFFLMMALFYAVSLPPTRADQEKTYVGSETCLGCHAGVTPGVVQGLQNSLHEQALARATLPEDRRGCEACHGPGSAHVANPPEAGTTGVWPKLPHAYKDCINFLWHTRVRALCSN